VEPVAVCPLPHVKSIVANVKDLVRIVPGLIDQNRVTGVIDIQLLGPERTVVRASLEVNCRLTLAKSLGVRLLVGA